MNLSLLSTIIKNIVTGAAVVVLSLQPVAVSSVSGNTEPPQAPINISQDKGVSLNWSGYTATGGTFTGVSGTWMIPKVVAGSSNFGVDATWVGIGGVGSNDLIQAGTQAVVDRSGQVTYQAFWETLPQVSQDLPINVNSGDSITVSLSGQDNNQWLITFKDNTTGQSTEVNPTYNSSLSSADWIEEAPSSTRRLLPLDNFGSVQFINTTAIKNGQTIDLTQANARAVTMADFSGQLLTSVSGIGNDGASFTINRTNTQAQAFVPRRRRLFFRFD